MSTLSTEREQTTCNHCDSLYTHGYNEDYCSEECKNRCVATHDILNTLNKDHRYCSSCFTQLKSVRKSKPSDPDCFIGFQYLSGNTMKGEKHVTRPGTEQFDARLIDSHGTICAQCGATNHKDTYIRDEGLLQYEVDGDMSNVGERLFKALRHLKAEASPEDTLSQYSFDVARFVEVWNESPGEWAKALGASLISE